MKIQTVKELTLIREERFQIKRHTSQSSDRIMIDIELLYLVRGEVIMEVHHEISTTIPINHSRKDRIVTEIPVVIFFEYYRLFIYNNWSFSANIKDYKELKGQKIVEINIVNQLLELKLDSFASITVDLSDEGFNGPESLVLHGPNNLLVVWN